MGNSANHQREEIAALLPRLRRFARAMTGDAADADDLVQSALERALMRLDQFQPGTRLDAWLFQITRNAWIDEVRARGRRAKVFSPEDAGAHIGDNAPAEMESHLDAQAVWRAMQELPEDQRAAIALVCIEGLPYREAAAAMGVPIGTLTSRLARGRQMLEKMFPGGAP